MKQLISIAFILALLPAMALAAEEARFMTWPDIHGDRIVFSYDGDLWSCPAEGGQAIRLTSHRGSEIAPRFSPDGKWIAFTGSYQGADIYLIPSQGGTPRRLTYLPGGGLPLTWTPDGKHVVFQSGFGRQPMSRDNRLYKVSIDGSLPELLPVDRGMNCSFSEDGQRMLYVRKGIEDYYWKRYKGGRYPDIWMFNFAGGQFTPVTSYVGKNAYPMWIGNTMYFVSDRDANGISNLWAQDLKTNTVRQVTQFADFDVMTPSTDRKRIVFVQNGTLQVIEPNAKSPKKLSVQVNTDNWMLQDRWINPAEYVQFMDVSNDGRHLALTARGDIYDLIPGEKETAWKNLSASPGTRELYGRISPDGKSVAFFSDRSGEYQLYMQGLGGGPATALTDGLNCFVYHLRWSPDGSKILFGNKDFAVFYLEVATRKLVKVDESRFLDNDEFTWEISDYSWSPDSRWIAYSFCTENRNNVIWLFDTQAGSKVQLTNDFYDNLNPRWDAAGGYLYFLSNRNYQIQMDLFEDNHIVQNPTQVMAVQLRKGEKPPFARALGDPEAQAAAKGKEGGESPDRFRVDVEGLQDRVFPLPVGAGNYFHLIAGKGYVGWSGVPAFTEEEYEEFYAPGGRTKWSFQIFSMKDGKAVELEDKIAAAQVSVNGEQLVFKKDARFHLTGFDKAYQGKKLGTAADLSGLTYHVVPQEEWNQIFSDTWRWYRDFFYDQEMHGRDWKAMGDKYRAYLKELRTRNQLNWVLSEMVGELCVSHTYISGGDLGQEPAPPSPLFTGLLGADLAADTSSGYYRFARIYGPTRYYTGIEMPLSRPDVQVQQGDYLLAINGQPVKVPENYFKLLQVAKDDYVTLTVNGRPSMDGARSYRVKPVRSEQEARYAAWVTDNIEKVLKLSNGEVGYMHITAMGGGGIMQFDKFWRAFRYKKGLIIDVRGNSGGWTEYFMIDKLERRQVAYNVLQGMEPYRYPNPASRAHFVAVSNEHNGSDGEAFIEHFKARSLGTVVGVPSWGGLVGIVNGQPTLDGGTIQQSNNAFYGKDGKWLVENHGADPDILQDNDPASVMSGKDLQLEKAVEVALKKIKEQPWVFPPVPKYPKK